MLHSHHAACIYTAYFPLSYLMLDTSYLMLDSSDAHTFSLLRRYAWEGMSEEVSVRRYQWGGISEKVSVRRYEWEGMSEKVAVLDCALLHSSDARSWEHIQDVDTYVECTCSTHLMSEAEEEDTCMCCTRQSSCAQIWCRFRQRVVVLGVTRCCYSVDMCTYKYLDICVYVNM